MEDRNVVCLSFPNHPEYALFGVFDGFNGFYASAYLQKNLLPALDKLDNLDDDDLIISTMSVMDQNWFKSNQSEDEKYDKNAGSTVVFALIKQNKLQSDNTSSEYITRVFWAGDSRAVALIQNEKNKFEQNNITVDHHCDVEQEAKRITNANGEIINNRIDGQVAISRCFGCQVMKNNMDLPDTEQKMIATLECKHLSCSSDDILLLFCDGLIAGNWTNDRLVANYLHNYRQHKHEKNGLLNCLIYLAEQAGDDGSKDNITVISVQFKNNKTSLIDTGQDLYRPALSTGIYGSYFYSLKHDNQSKNIKTQKHFQLKYVYDDEKMRDDQLTDVEKQNIIEFGKLLSSKHGYIQNVDYLYSDLVRYVIGCKQRLEIAERNFLNLKSLELRYNLNDIRLSDIASELEKECYMLCGHDWQNNAIIGFRINKFVKKGMNIGVMIRAMHCLIDAVTSSIYTLRNGIVLLFDLKGVRKENMSSDLETIFIKSFQNCYPLRIKKFIVVDAPVLFRAAMQIAKLLLSKKLSGRIISVKSVPNGDLWKLVPHQAVPKCINGKFDSCMNAWQYVCSKTINNVAKNLKQQENKYILDKLCEKKGKGKWDKYRLRQLKLRNNGILEYWDDKILKGSIEDKFKNVQKNENKGEIMQFGWQIITAQRIWYFAANDDDERNEWIENIRRFCDEFKPNDQQEEKQITL